MIYFVILISVFAGACGQSPPNNYPEKWNTFTKACAEKYNLTFKKYEDYIKSVPASGDKIQLFAQCLFQKLGYLSSNGEILYEEIKKTPYPGVPSDKYCSFVNLCKSQVGSNITERSYKFSSCLLNSVNNFYKEQKRQTSKQADATKTNGKPVQLTKQQLQQQQKAEEEFQRDQLRLKQQQQHLQQQQQQTQKQVEYFRQQFHQQHTTFYQQLQEQQKQVQQIHQKSQEQSPQLEQLRQQLQQEQEQMQKQFKEQQQRFQLIVDQVQKQGGQLQQQFQQQTQQLNQVKSTIQQRQQQSSQLYQQMLSQQQQLQQQLQQRMGNHEKLKLELNQREQLLQQQQQQLQQIKQERAIKICSERYKIPIKNLEDYHKALVAGGEQNKLFSECYLLEHGYLSSNGTILHEEVKKESPPGVPYNQYSNIVDNCKSGKGNNTSETSYKFSICLLKSMQKFNEEQKQFQLLQQQKQQQELQRQKELQLIKLCATKHNLQIRTFEEYNIVLNKGGEQVQQFCRCYLEQLGYTYRNNILYEDIKKTPAPGISSEKYSYLVDTCRGEKGSSNAETMYKFLHCLHSKINETYREQSSSNLVKRDAQSTSSFEKQQLAINTCAKTANLTIKSLEDYGKAFVAGGVQIQLFSDCYLRELNYVSSNNEILYDEVKKSPSPGITKEKYSSIVDQCKSEKGGTALETYSKFLNCLQFNVNQTKQRQQEKQELAIQVCLEKSNITIQQSTNYSKVLAEGGKQMHLFSECYLRELGYVNSNADILYEEVKKSPAPHVLAEKYSSFVDLCKSEKRNNTAETCYKFLSCLQSNIDQVNQQKVEIK